MKIKKLLFIVKLRHSGCCWFDWKMSQYKFVKHNEQPNNALNNHVETSIDYETHLFTPKFHCPHDHHHHDDRGFGPFHPNA